MFCSLTIQSKVLTASPTARALKVDLEIEEFNQRREVVGRQYLALFDDGPIARDEVAVSCRPLFGSVSTADRRSRRRPAGSIDG